MVCREIFFFFEASLWKSENDLGGKMRSIGGESGVSGGGKEVAKMKPWGFLQGSSMEALFSLGSSLSFECSTSYDT